MRVDLDKSMKTKEHTIAARQNSIPNYTIFGKNIKVIKDSVLIEIKTHENKFFGNSYVIIYWVYWDLSSLGSFLLRLVLLLLSLANVKNL